MTGSNRITRRFAVPMSHNVYCLHIQSCLFEVCLRLQWSSNYSSIEDGDMVQCPSFEQSFVCLVCLVFTTSVESVRLSGFLQKL